MTNDQQTSLGQVSGSEPHQLPQQPQHENIELTELLPVEQSRIKDNPGDRDQETTDGLKALRSFSCGEHEDFDSNRDYDCFDKLDPTYEDEIDGEHSEGDRGGGSRKRKSSAESRINTFRLTRRITVEHGVTKNLRRNRRRGRNGAENDHSGDEGEKHRDHLGSRKSLRANDRLDPVRDEVEEEVYYFRQQQLEPCEISTNDEDGETNLEILTAGVYRDMANNFSEVPQTKDSLKLSETSTKKSTKKPEKQRKNKTGKKESKKKRRSLREESRLVGPDVGINDSPKVALVNRDEAEKDLRLKIDGIIQANYLLERENNNVVQRNHNEISNSPSTLDSSQEPNSTVESRVENNVSGAHNSEDDSSKQEDVQSAKKYCCVMCTSRFKGSGGLRNHYKVVHAAGPLYKCDECGKEFPLKERLKLHVRTHTGFKPYKCPDCHKSFARGGQLVQHRGTHSKVKPYRCNLCAGTFTCAANLALHVKRHNGQKDHKCEICGRGFVRKDALKKHLECLHRDVKSFLCVICNKTFKGHLPQHMRTHAQDRPHGCATCGQRFAQKSQLTVHQRTHSGQRPFRCLVCWQAFAHSTALKLHTRRHTGERPFKCAECNAGFTQLPHWKKHMKCIHGRSEPYHCKNCNSFFRIKNDLENHEKSCKFDEVVDDIAKNNSVVEATGGSSSSPVDTPKFRVMNVERMRLLLAVLLKRISRPERLDELGFGKRLIDEVLQDSLISAGKEPSRIGEVTELESLRKNLETFLEWTVPKEHWDMFRKMNKTPEEILETLTAT